MYQVITLYTLNLYKVVYQLYLNNLGKKDAVQADNLDALIIFNSSKR